jgi:hypothetical protein
VPQISLAALTALLTRLTDAETGFNANLAAVAPTYGIEPYVVDWSQTTSANFLIGQVDPNALEQSSTFTYPFTTVDTGLVVDDARVVSAVFAGTIALVIEVHISLESEDFPRYLTPLAQAIEDAMFATVNNRDEIGVYMSALLTYNGKWTLQKSSIQFAGNNWRRTLRFTASVGRITN